MQFGEAFSFVFEDQDWLKKILIGAVLMLIPVIGWMIVVGWGLEITRRVVRKDPVLLPEWTDFGKLIIDGLLIMVIMFIYSLPANIVNGIAQGVNVAMQNGGDNGGDFAPVLVAVLACVGCFAFLYSLALGFISPAIMSNFAVEGGFGSGFQFGKIFAMVKAAPGAFLIAFLGSIVAGILSMVGLIACVIGVFFTMAYASAVTYHLAGQAYNQAQINMGAAPVQVSIPPEA